jgi:hypothetical protein
VNLKAAEQYVGAFGNLAKTNNSIIVPANLGDMSGLIATAMQVVKSQSPQRSKHHVARYKEAVTQSSVI